MRVLITEEEFDNLPVQTQMHYLYCPDCGSFYQIKTSHVCSTSEQPVSSLRSLLDTSTTLTRPI